MKSGDRLKEWVARPGKPSVLIDTVITSDGYEKHRIINKIYDTSKEWFFSADIDRAMKAAFDGIREKDKNYQCCLIIITKGQMSNKKVAKIRRYAYAFKERGWVVCIVCDREKANLRFLVAGNNDEFDIQFIDQTSLSDWIDNIRTTSAQNKLKDTATQKTKDSKVQPSVRSDGGVKQPIEVKIVGLPDGKTYKDVNIPDSDRYRSEVTKKDSRSTDKEAPPSGTENGQKPKHSVLKTIWAIIFLIGIAVAMFLIVFSRRKSATGSRAVDQTDDNIPSHLIAFYGDHRYDLGPLDALGEILIGSGLGSTIYIDNETVEDKHVRIFKSRRELKIQNLACSPIIINGLELTHRRKSILDLPVDIELTSDATVTVLSEPVETNKELNDYENENI
jgi:hypothetical protein